MTTTQNTEETNKNKEIITDSDTSIPTLEDFYYNSQNPNTGTSSKDTSIEESFYKEIPPMGEDTVGINTDGTLFTFNVSLEEKEKNIKIYDNDIYSGMVDGDTFIVSKKSCNVNGGSAEDKQMLKDYLGNKISDDGFMSLRLLFINAPEIQHFSISGIDSSKVKKIKYGSINKQNSGYIYTNIKPEFLNKNKNTAEAYKNEDTVYFLDKYQIWQFESDSKKAWVLNGSGYINTETEAQKARLIRNKLVEKLKEAKEIKVCINRNSIRRNSISNEYPELFKTRYTKPDIFEGEELANLFNELFDDRFYRYSGYRLYGMDTYGRLLGIVYIKTNNGWINLNKYLIYTSFYDNNIKKDIYSNDKAGSLDVLMPNTYDIANANYVDNYWVNDDNVKRQNEMKKKVHDDVLKEAGYGHLVDNNNSYTVTIGDVTLFVPPESIRYINQTGTERVGFLRAKGTMSKNIEKSDSQLELSIFFNNEQGINGYAYTCPLWTRADGQQSSENATYYMNGLRALISQFKFTPFLPITNKYINNTLNIWAVTMENISIETVPGFPKLLRAVLRLGKFDYRVFMPELPDPYNNDDLSNPFASIINYDLLRYYYQKPLIKGNLIRNKLKSIGSTYTINSVEFIEDTLITNRSTLMPMDFNDPNINIYIADEDYLKKLLEIKKNAMVAATSGVESYSFTPTNLQQRLVKDLAAVYENTKKAIEVHNKAMTAAINAVIYGQKTPDGSYIFTIQYNGENIKVEMEEITSGYLNKDYAIRQLSDFVLNKSISLKYGLDAKNEYGENIVKQIKFDDYKITMDINCSYVYSKADVNDLIDYSLVGTDKYVTDKTFNDNKLVFNVYEAIEEAINSKIMEETVESYSIYNDLHFLQWCYENALSISDPNKETSELKEAIDWENSKSIKFNLIGEDIRVDSFQARLDNNFARVSLLDSDGYASQYLGGQDVRLSWKITAKDENFVAVMRGLTEYEAYCMRKYHLVLPSYPIKIDSEFTRFLGVFELSIENVVIETVKGYPGLYSIVVDAISVDRTLRNREALRSLSNIEDSAEDGISGTLNNQGITNTSMRTQINVRTYDELSSKLAKAEVYPDLELPKIEELNNKNFLFIKYKNKIRQSLDLYVDPDFYFFYPHQTRADIIRAAIQEQFTAKENDAREKFIYSDLSGAKVELDELGNIDPKSMNKKALEAIEEAKTNESRKAADTKTITSPEVLFGANEKWDISTKIMTSFQEKDTIIDEKIKKIVDYSTFELGKDGIRKSLEKKIDPNVILNYGSYGRLASSYIYSDFREHLKNLKISFDLDEGQLHTSVKNMFQAAHDALTATYEYNQTLDDDKWKGISGYTGLEKDGSEINKDEIDIRNIYSVGIYNIPILSLDEYLRYEPQKSDIIKSSNARNLVLDSYYANKDQDAINDYLKNCILDPKFCIAAFTRNVMWWMAKLYEDNVYPSLSFDIMRNIMDNIVESKKRAQSNKVVKEFLSEIEENGQTDDNVLTRYAKEFNEKLGQAMDAGKFFVAITLTIYGCPPDENNKLYNDIKQRNYDALRQYLLEISSEHFKHRNNANNRDAKVRRFILALCGHKEINAPEYIGRKSSITPIARAESVKNVKLSLEAANNPQQYIFHSFYDMARNDYRGRMLKAFPTFYCIFMDEGKEIGLWKLHDNFYSINAINEISITKSRKIPADLCTITLSNNYSTFTMDDEDGYINYKGATWTDLWDSVWNKKKYALNEEKKRYAAEKINRAKLQPGIRIHVRMGYGSDARELGTSFNGVITGVQPGNKIIEIIAQGNGIEVTNPLLEDRDADEIQYKDRAGDSIINTCGAGATPKKILSSILTYKGGAFASWIKGQYDLSNNKEYVADEDKLWIPDAVENFLKECWDDNPYGIMSFGDAMYKDVFPDGEILQNIYEVSSMPKMECSEVDIPRYEHNTTVSDEYIADSPYISFETQGKSFWEIMHICKSVAPDYITAIADFDLRSTIFFGKPHYYYAYGYKKANGRYIERRKPYQQYHLYFADSDIIENNITADSRKIRTVATGLYQDKNVLVTRNKDVGPLWVDKNIYPEVQKSMVVDTKLKMKDGSVWKTDQTDTDVKTGILAVDSIYNVVKGGLQNLASATVGVVATPASIFMEEFCNFDDKGVWSNHKKIAWCATANALKESVKEMYQGNMVIIGDPSVKPHDRLIISDEYNDMNGQVLVRDVVHHLSARTGFRTTVHVDTIATVDDRDEMYKQNLVTHLVGKVMIGTFLSLPAKMMYNKGFTYLWSGAGDKTGVIKTAAQWALDNTKENSSVYNFLNKYGTAIKEYLADNDPKATKKTISILLDAADTARDATVLATKTAMTMISKVGPQILITMIVQALAGSIHNAIYDRIKNHKVLQIFPLKKNGRPYTAGLDGNLGLVYGSSTFNQSGPMERMFSYLAPNKEHDPVINAMKQLLLSEDIQNAAARYCQDYKYASAIGINDTNDEKNLDALSLAVMKSPEVHSKNTAYGLSLFPREVQNTISKKNAYQLYYIENIKDLFEDTFNKRYVLINDYEPLQKYLNSKSSPRYKLNVIFEEDPNQIKTRTLDVKIGQKMTKVIALRGKRKDRETLTVPYLTKDALVILTDICNKVKEAFKEDGYEMTLLTSLTINSDNLEEGSGMYFGLSEKNNKDILSVVQKMRNDIEQQGVISAFDIEKGTNSIYIKVHPVSQIKRDTKETYLNKAKDQSEWGY